MKLASFKYIQYNLFLFLFVNVLLIALFLYHTKQKKNKATILL